MRGRLARMQLHGSALRKSPEPLIHLGGEAASACVIPIEMKAEASPLMGRWRPPVDTQAVLIVAVFAPLATRKYRSMSR